jgi:hypothetical protein
VKRYARRPKDIGAADSASGDCLVFNAGDRRRGRPDGAPKNAAKTLEFERFSAMS